MVEGPNRWGETAHRDLGQLVAMGAMTMGRRLPTVTWEEFTLTLESIASSQEQREWVSPMVNKLRRRAPTMNKEALLKSLLILTSEICESYGDSSVETTYRRCDGLSGCLSSRRAAPSLWGRLLARMTCWPIFRGTLALSSWLPKPRNTRSLERSKR
jgi:hypothetical protein